MSSEELDNQEEEAFMKVFDERMAPFAERLEDCLCMAPPEARCLIGRIIGEMNGEAVRLGVEQSEYLKTAMIRKEESCTA